MNNWFLASTSLLYAHGCYVVMEFQCHHYMSSPWLCTKHKRSQELAPQLTVTVQTYSYVAQSVTALLLNYLVTLTMMFLTKLLQILGMCTQALLSWKTLQKIHSFQNVILLLECFINYRTSYQSQTFFD